MKLRNQDDTEARVTALVARLVRDFDLGWMTFRNSFDPRIDGDRVVCDTACDFEYRQATFVWNSHQVATMLDDELEQTAIHEVVHCLNAALWESLSENQKNKLSKLNELATENVARVIIHLYKGATP